MTLVSGRLAAQPDGGTTAPGTGYFLIANSVANCFFQHKKGRAPQTVGAFP
jgi:hypothetical protein